MFAFLFKRKDSRTILNGTNIQSLREEIKRKHRVNKFNEAIKLAKSKNTGRKNNG